MTVRSCARARRAARSVTLAALAGATAASVTFGIAAPAAANGGEIGGTGANYSFQDSPGSGPTTLRYGRPWDRALLGDWDGDGIDTLAVRRGNLYYFTNSFNGGVADTVISYGRPGDTVLVGDWDGDGIDTLAVRRGNKYFIKNDLTSGVADIELHYGRAMDVALVGDWNGDGIDTIAVHRQGVFYLANSFKGGEADRRMWVGGTADIPIAGDWDGDGRDDVGVRDGVDATMTTLTQRGVKKIFEYGTVRQRILVGDWNGDGVDTFGLRTSDAAELKDIPAHVTGAEITLQAAREKIGNTYVWGANGPEEYDCSGLTRYAYSKAGVWLPRVSGEQAKVGIPIEPEEAQPGDLIWWPGHVAIYVGNGMKVDAANESLGILERPVSPNPTFFRLL